MAYGFNDDKSKAEVYAKDDFVIINDTGTMGIFPANSGKVYNVHLERDFGLSQNDYSIIGVGQFKISPDSLFMTSYQETNRGGSIGWCLEFTVWNTTSSAINGASVDTNITLVRK